MDKLLDKVNLLQNQAEKFKIHFGYVIGILVAVIVWMATVHVGGDQNVTNYIGFAATLSSLILSLLAIYLSISGNAEFSAFTSSVSRTTSDLRGAADQISEIASKLGGM